MVEKWKLDNGPSYCCSNAFLLKLCYFCKRWRLWLEISDRNHVIDDLCPDRHRFVDRTSLAVAAWTQADWPRARWREHSVGSWSARTVKLHPYQTSLLRWSRYELATNSCSHAVFVDFTSLYILANVVKYVSSYLCSYIFRCSSHFVKNRTSCIYYDILARFCKCY